MLVNSNKTSSVLEDVEFLLSMLLADGYATQRDMINILSRDLGEGDVVDENTPVGDLIVLYEIAQVLQPRVSELVGTIPIDPKKKANVNVRWLNKEEES